MPTFEEDFEAALAELLPAMEPDGGGAELVSIDGSSAVLRLVGSCLFCPSRELSAAALERGLRSRVPGIENVRIL
jgi:Fe-S cluster biogenesis protein NfuA